MKKGFIIFLLTLFLVFILKTNVYAQKEIGDYGVNVDLTFDYFSAKEVRSAEYKITDSGRFKQSYDIIRFNDLYNGNYDLDDLYSNGYRTLCVEIEMELKEVDKGYQHIFIYDDLTKNTWLTGAKYSLGGGDKVTTYQRVTFYLELNLANINDNYFVVRYGASGSFDDDWKNRNIKVFVGASKEVQKTQNIWALTWNDTTHMAYTASKLEISN